MAWNYNFIANSTEYNNCAMATYWTFFSDSMGFLFSLMLKTTEHNMSLAGCVFTCRRPWQQYRISLLARRLSGNINKADRVMDVNSALHHSAILVIGLFLIRSYIQLLNDRNEPQFVSFLLSLATEQLFRMFRETKSLPFVHHESERCQYFTM